jgi:general secretion pathway protein G
MMPRVRRRHGFTLIEVVITVAIISILASGLMPLMELDARRGREQELRRSLREVRQALDAYKRAADNGQIAKQANASGYPPSLEILTEGVPDITSPTGARIYFLRRLPRDPLVTDNAIPAAATWGKRSYASPPDAPAAGDDVFDVYSLTPGTGINGVPYRQW